MTNFRKLVQWDVDFYNSLSDEVCLYCLTEKQRYLIGQTLDQVTWAKTRWVGDTSTIDLEEIKGDLEYRISNKVDEMDTCDICDLIQSCIENDADVRAALKEILRETNNGDNNGNNPIGSGSGDVLSGVACDLDTLYGVAVAIEDYLNAVCEDILERVQDADGIAEWLVKIIDIIPIIGDLPVVDDLNDVWNNMTTEGLNSYQAGYTTQVRQDNICALWQLMCSSCELNTFDLVDFYASQAGGAITPDSTFETVLALLTGTLSNEIFVYAMLALVSGALSTGSSVAGLAGLDGLNLIARTAEASNDHATLCDPCAPTGFPVIVNVSPCFADTRGTVEFVSDGVYRLTSDFVSGSVYSGVIAEQSGALIKVVEVITAVRDTVDNQLQDANQGCAVVHNGGITSDMLNIPFTDAYLAQFSPTYDVTLRFEFV